MRIYSALLKTTTQYC